MGACNNPPFSGHVTQNGLGGRSLRPHNHMPSIRWNCKWKTWLTKKKKVWEALINTLLRTVIKHQGPSSSDWCHAPSFLSPKPENKGEKSLNTSDYNCFFFFFKQEISHNSTQLDTVCPFIGFPILGIECTAFWDLEWVTVLWHIINRYEGFQFLGVGGNQSAWRKPTKADMESANQIHIQPLASCIGERKVLEQ